jgi:SAM-dependent methyltransferase
MIFTEIKCPVCNSKKYYKWKSWIEKNHKFQVSVCKNCGFVYQNPRIKYNDLDLFFKEYYYDRDEKQKILKDICKDCNCIAKDNEKEISKANHVYEFIKKFIKDKKNPSILDIGSDFNFLQEFMGLTHNLDDIDESKINIVGISPSRQSSHPLFKILKNKFENWYDDRETKNKCKDLQTFDIIILCHTFEHFYNPYIIVKKLFNLLSEDGILYIEVPSFHTGLLKTKELIKIPEHFSFFTKQSLMNCFRDVNFGILKIEESKKFGNIKCIFSKNCSKWQEIKKENWIMSLIKYYISRLN